MRQKEKRSGSGSSLFSKLQLIIVIAIVFSVGVNFGNGRFHLDFRSSPKPVATGLPAKLDYNSLDAVYQSLKDNYNGSLSEDQLIDGMKHGLAEATKDPYTVYFTSKEAKEFNDQLNNSFAGIGARLSKDDDGNLIVGESISGFPADEAGLKARDIITDVGGVQTNGITLDDAITKIRGPVGTKVKLKVVRDKAQTLDFTITRETIKLPSITTKKLDGNIGYIQIGSFGDDTTALTKKAAQQFKDDGVKGIVLDMRNNPGGLLESSVDVSSLWLPRGTTILEEKRGDTVTQRYTARGEDILNGIPTVVLINEGSASASEITAGALRDNNAARIIGTKSYGKGVVQQLICITGARYADNTCPKDVLKVTVASWYRPNGQNINKKGITPDSIVKISDADAKASKDPQLEAAQAYLNK